MNGGAAGSRQDGLELLTNDEALLHGGDVLPVQAPMARWDPSRQHRPDMHEHAMARFEVQADLERAVTRHEFLLQHQPIVDLKSERVHGIEALVRWMHPTRGLLPPGEFIRVAEETGLIVPIGDWVLGEACRQTVAWRESYPTADLWVSVNLSARQLLEADRVQRVARVLASTGLDPAALDLELTEGSLMQDVTTTIVKLRDLKALGVRLAIDDFGTGSSSLGYLRHFPIDDLKIDKSFVDELDQTGGRRSGSRGRDHRDGAHAGSRDGGRTYRAGRAALGSPHRWLSFGSGFLFARPFDPSLLEDLLRAAMPLPAV
jgi:EAL domain-containing protein (putative c-di-GMP-specific phosphodiesterase class I)